MPEEIVIATSGTVYDNLLKTIEENNELIKSMGKEREKLQQTVLKGSIEYQKMKSSKDFIDGCLDDALLQVRTLEHEATNKDKRIENLSGKVSTLLFHLKSFCTTWENIFDYQCQQKTAQYSYEELQEYIDAASYLEKVFERKDNRVREAEEMQEQN